MHHHYHHHHQSAPSELSSAWNWSYSKPKGILSCGWRLNLKMPCFQYEDSLSVMGSPFKPLRPRQNGRHFADDTLNRIFLNENVRISIAISLKFAPKGSINNIPTLVQIMAWRRPGDKPLSESMMVSLMTHIGVTRPQ